MNIELPDQTIPIKTTVVTTDVKRIVEVLNEVSSGVDHE